jgi:hypothetical protein
LFPASSPSYQADYSQVFFAHNLATRHVSDRKAMLGASLRVFNVMKRLVGSLRCSCHYTVLVITKKHVGFKAYLFAGPGSLQHHKLGDKHRTMTGATQPANKPFHYVSDT